LSLYACCRPHKDRASRWFQVRAQSPTKERLKDTKGCGIRLACRNSKVVIPATATIGFASDDSDTPFPVEEACGVNHPARSISIPWQDPRRRCPSNRGDRSFHFAAGIPSLVVRCTETMSVDWFTTTFGRAKASAALPFLYRASFLASLVVHPAEPAPIVRALTTFNRTLEMSSSRHMSPHVSSTYRYAVDTRCSFKDGGSKEHALQG
jgi:hypothetical protein